jgi:hypothetical protein
MSQAPIPTRITIDFRDAVHPSRTWILGVDERTPQRVELIAFEAQPRRLDRPMPAARSVTRRDRGSHRSLGVLHAECACPDFCERDHANE